jgi:hypothetical protein
MPVFVIDIQGYNIISVLTSEIVPIMELLSSMKTHSVPEDIDVSIRSHRAKNIVKLIILCRPIYVATLLLTVSGV